MVDYATIGASVGLSALASLLVAFFTTEYRLRREQSVEEKAEIEDWYSDTKGYAAEVRRNWQRLFDSPDRSATNLNELKSEMSLLEGQISRHASQGEQLGVASEAVEALDKLAHKCRKPANQNLYPDSKERFEEFRTEVLNAVDDVEEAVDQKY
jgi:hypothetical protein